MRQIQVHIHGFHKFKTNLTSPYICPFLYRPYLGLRPHSKKIDWWNLSLRNLIQGDGPGSGCDTRMTMVEFVSKLLLVARSRLSQVETRSENIVLFRQVIVLSRKALSRVRLRNIDLL